MPSGMAAAMRQLIAEENKEELELKRTPWSKTGFVNVIKIGGMFQARLQVPGDGRGGTRKRQQCPLPGLFETAEDAAVMLAKVEKMMKEKNGGKVVVPKKQNKPHKPRTKKATPAVASPLPPPMPAMPVATTVAFPMLYPMQNMPFAAAVPLPMQPLCEVPMF